MRVPMLLALATLAAACGDSAPAPPTSPTAPTLPTTELFVGALPVGGARFYAFSPTATSTVRLTLASLTAPGAIAASGEVVGLAFGIPRGTGCSHDQTVDTRSALSAQLVVADVAPGVRCVDVYDIGGLRATVNFAIRISVIPAGSAAGTAAPGGDTFASIVPVQGSATRAIVASQAGLLSVNLTSLTPADAVFGVGVGIPRADGAGCLVGLSTDFTTGVGPFAHQVDPGVYCVRAFDSGFLTGAASFTLTTLFP